VRDPRSRFVILAALVANLAIAVVKAIAAVVTGSSAMVAETAHSLVDTGDAVLLLVGEHLADRPATERHPFGHGKELYFWTFIVAMVVFVAGGTAAIIEGIYHLLNPERVREVIWSYVVLAAAAVFEGTSFVISVRSLLAYRREELPGYSLTATIRAAKDPTKFVIVLEDGAALLGLLFAFFGVLLAHTFDAPALDALASLLVGALLIAVAYVLGRECRSLLIGERALPSVIEGIRGIACAQPGGDEVVGLKTMHLGAEAVLLALRVRFAPRLPPAALPRVIAGLREAIPAHFPEVKRVLVDACSFASPAPQRDVAGHPRA
jgi:cation diffusion facilitator family transporter